MHQIHLTHLHCKYEIIKHQRTRNTCNSHSALGPCIAKVMSPENLERTIAPTYFLGFRPGPARVWDTYGGLVGAIHELVSGRNSWDVWPDRMSSALPKYVINNRQLLRLTSSSSRKPNNENQIFRQPTYRLTSSHTSKSPR